MPWFTPFRCVVASTGTGSPAVPSLRSNDTAEAWLLKGGGHDAGADAGAENSGLAPGT